MDAPLVLGAMHAIDPASGLDEIVDIVIERGRISRIGRDAAADLPATLRRISAPGAYVLPGFVDMHVHLREPGFEHKEDMASGLRAAAAGGFVSVCPMPNTEPTIDSPEWVRYLTDRATSLGGTQVHPIAAITLGQEGATLAPHRALRDAGAVALSDDGRCVTRTDIMRSALWSARELDLLVIQHCEEHALTKGAVVHEGEVSRRLGLPGWPRVAEDVIVARDLALVDESRARYHVAHASTEGTVRLLRQAKDRGLPVSAEVTPHHLLLTDAAFELYATSCKVNPPLRERADVDALCEGLRDGTIDCIATDHAPHTSAEKGKGARDAPYGIMGLELAMSLVFGLVRDGRVPLARLVDALTRAPSRLVGIESPSLRVGDPARLTVFDPSASWVVGADTLQSRSHNTPYFGQRLMGRVILTIERGDIRFEVPR